MRAFTSTLGFTALLAGAFGSATVAPTQAETILRVVPQADLKILDPVWTTSQLTQAHALMVYDQLFAIDSKLVPRPQMVESWTTSADALTWSFKLRPNLKFSDGTAVTAKDATASLKRWAARTTDGQLLMKFVQSVEATATDTFEVRLTKPFPSMLETLGNATTPLFVMREKEALTDPFQQIKEVVGSGPFTYAPSEHREGHKVVYRKNPYANPRPEPTDGMAGGRVAKVDTVEWIIMPDPAVAVSALRRGEVDVLENAPYDLISLIERDPGVMLSVTDPLGQQGIVRFNHLIPPFNDPKVRQAFLLAIDRPAYLAAMVGDRRFEINCGIPFICGTVSETDAGAADYAKPDLEKARAMLAASAYRGEPVVVLDPTDYTVIHAMTLVTADRLRAIGFNVDLQAMTWSLVVGRRSNRDPPKDGRSGWHVFHTVVPSVAMISPITNYLMASACDGKNWFGWPCDEELERLRLTFLDTPQSAQKQAYAAIQKRYWEAVPFASVGQFVKPIAHRKSVSGFVASPILAVWNVEKR